MGWGRTLLLGDIGNRLDIQDVEADMDHLRELVEGKAGADEDQDRRIADLEAENRELKLYLAALIRALVAKVVLSPGEVTTFVDKVEQ